MTRSRSERNERRRVSRGLITPSIIALCYRALQRAGVATELHLYAEGGHGFGLRQTRFPITGWPRLVESWLQTIGVVPP